MAVTNLLTLIEDCEGALGTITSIGGGAGATANTDIFILGSQSLGRRSSGATTHGFFLNVGAAFNLSGAGQHVKVWTWLTHYTSVTALEYRIGSDTSNYETHSYNINNIPDLGGWFPAWLEVNAGTDTGTPNFTIIDEIGQAISISTVGGNAANNIFDQIHHGTSGMRWDGSGGAVSDFRTTEAANALGALLSRDGIDYLFSRLEIGSSTATTFTDSNIVIVFPDQPRCSSTFMGLTFDLQNASTSISLTSSVIVSGNPTAASRRGDLLVSGTAGTLDISKCTFNGLRILNLNEKVTANNCVFANDGYIDGYGANLDNSIFSGFTGGADSSYLKWNINLDPDGRLDGCSFTKGSAATHAIEFGTLSPTTMTLRDVIFSSYNASNNQNDSAIHIKRTSGTVTINIVGGTSPSYRSDGATVDIVSNPVTTSVNVKDISDNSNIQNARVLILASDGTGPMPYQKSTTITRSGSTATATCTAHGLLTNDYVIIKGANQVEYNGPFQVTVTNSNTFTYTVSGTPATPATGAITTTGAPLYGLTDSSGNLSASRTYSSNQPITGRVRKATSGTLYKTGAITGTINNSTGFSATVQLIRDQ